MSNNPTPTSPSNVPMRPKDVPQSCYYPGFYGCWHSCPPLYPHCQNPKVYSNFYTDWTNNNPLALADWSAYLAQLDACNAASSTDYATANNYATDAQYQCNQTVYYASLVTSSTPVIDDKINMTSVDSAKEDVENAKAAASEASKSAAALASAGNSTS